MAKDILKSIPWVVLSLFAPCLADYDGDGWPDPLRRHYRVTSIG
jgi:hypothetical protein